MERTGRSNGLMMGYFGNAEAPGAPFAFYYCDHLYADSWNKTDASSDGACWLEWMDAGMKSFGGGEGLLGPPCRGSSFRCPPLPACPIPPDHLPKLVDRHQFFGDAYDFVHLVRKGFRSTCLCVCMSLCVSGGQGPAALDAN